MTRKPSPELLHELDKFTHHLYIDGTAIMEWEEAHHGSDYTTKVADVGDADWELVVLALRFEKRVQKDKEDAEKAAKRRAQGMTNEALASDLRYGRRDDLEAEAVKTEVIQRLNGVSKHGRVGSKSQG